MTRETVVLLGNFPFEAPAFRRAVEEAGWTLEVANDFDGLREMSTFRRPAAILLDAPGQGLSWQEALQTARQVDPEALLIACHRFSESLNWPALAEAGAFHSLALPFDASEVRQSLAFVGAAWMRRASRAVTEPQRSAGPGGIRLACAA